MKNGRKSKQQLIETIAVLQQEIAALKASRVLAYSEHAMVRKELWENSERLNFYQDNSPMAIIEWDTGMVVRRWTGAAEKMFGWSAEETVGRVLPDLKMFHEADIPEIRRSLEKLKNDSAAQVVTLSRNYRKDGEIIHCEWYNSILRDKSGNMQFVLSSAIDITEKKKNEILLREREERLLAAQEVASVGCWETDLMNFHVYWTDETYRIFELDKDQFLSSHPDFLNFVHPDDKEKVNAAFLESFTSRSTNVIVHRIITPSGGTKYVEERWRIIFNDQDRPERALGTCREVMTLMPPGE